MRPIERIKPFMQLLRTETNSKTHKYLKVALGYEFEDTLNALEETWLKNPDWRFTQLLVNTNVLPNIPGLWYYAEEIDIFPEHKSELFFWGTYGKDGKQPYKKIAIRDMTSNHLKACLETQTFMNLDYRVVMEEELKLREKMLDEPKSLLNSKDLS